MLQDVSCRSSTVSIRVAREFRRTLRGLVSLEDNDHYPIRLQVRLQPWGGGRKEPRPGEYDRQEMVRSCLTWYEKAQEYTMIMQRYFWDVYMSTENIMARRSDPDNSYNHMAQFLWNTEDLMNSTAATLWPKRGKQHAVPFTDEVKSKLRWLAILRKRAWLTVGGER